MDTVKRSLAAGEQGLKKLFSLPTQKKIVDRFNNNFLGV
jgi:hypothetical protein